MATRTLQRIIRSVHASDGAGVKLRRSLGQSDAARLDPFLMLDEFSSEDANDYIAGFPDHPHRGFETVTYMLDGHMLHQDHLGNRGDLKSGDVQWMSAGRGIIHSEMPQQDRGRMRGFQLWINLPAKEKMKPAAYRDLRASEIPDVPVGNGSKARVIAGSHGGVSGPIQGLSTDATYLDVSLAPGESFSQPVVDGYNVFLYPYEGSLKVGTQVLQSHDAGVLSTTGTVEVSAGDERARFLILAGKPIGEPIVQYGPFVMNTRAEIEQAIRDYQNGVLASA